MELKNELKKLHPLVRNEAWNVCFKQFSESNMEYNKKVRYMVRTFGISESNVMIMLDWSCKVVKMNRCKKRDGGTKKKIKFVQENKKLKEFI